MNQTSKSVPGLVIDRDNLLNLVQTYSLLQLIAEYEDPDTPEADALVAKAGVTALMKEIEKHFPRGEA